MITPGATLVVDDAGDVGVAELAAKLRHRGIVFDAVDRGALQAEHHDMDVLARIRVIDDGIALERRECARQTVTRRLMAGRAIGAEELQTLAGVCNHLLLAGPLQQAHLPLYLLEPGSVSLRLPRRPGDEP